MILLFQFAMSSSDDNTHDEATADVGGEQSDTKYGCTHYLRRCAFVVSELFIDNW